MSYKLYTYPQNYRAWKSLIAAEYSGLEIEVPQFEMGKDNKTVEFLAKNPQGKVPVLETPSGSLFESGAICRYVARLRPEAQLFGKTHFQSGQVEQWIEFCTNELEAARSIWIYPILGYIGFDEKAYQAAKKDVANALTVLNNHLAARTFLVGQSVTLADIVLVSALVHLYQLVFSPEYIKPFGNVTRWFTTCINQPEFAKIIGKVEFAKEEKKAEKAKGGKGGEKKEQQAPAGKGDKGGKKEEPKKKDEAKPKKEEPKKDLAEELEAEEARAAKKKEKNPLDLLPESKMSLDATKKLMFSERPYNPKFFAEFWKNFDNAGYSIWTIKYKYDDENKIFFMTGNLIGGFVQRAEDVRKYAMGVVNIVGKDEDTPPFKINGAWLFRGVGIPNEMKECPDSEHYEWSRVDVTKADQRKLVEDLFTADTIQGNANLDRRYFK
jgi:elongation factor 1-gamma